MNVYECPAKALSVSTREQLGIILNVEQPLLSRDKVARDYRGLAQQVGFLCADIQNFQRFDNPTAEILKKWTTEEDATIGKLIEFLENMQRYHIIQDFQENFERDAELFSKMRLENHYQNEVPLLLPNDPNILTIHDNITGNITIYDAYICYADENLDFVYKLTSVLEENGFKLCLRKRDILAGHDEYSTTMKLIQERCKKVIIILSNDFNKSSVCKIEANFAASVQFEQNNRKLLPIILEDCEIPTFLRYISKIKFTNRHAWVWDRLINSLQDTSIISQKTASAFEKNLPPKLESKAPDVDNPIITYPPTTVPSNTASSLNNQLVESCTSDDSTTIPKNASSPKFIDKFLLFWTKNKIFKRSKEPISSSTNTSGFFSGNGNIS